MLGVTVPPWRSRFYLASRKCGTGQLHLFKHAPDRSAIPPVADVSLRRSEPPLRAMCGRLQVGKENLHVAGLVGAAMCSAFECGSHDRWP